MLLPNGDDYYQAVQNPAICFSDSDLKNCQVETNPFGLPNPYSGGFTSTYKLSAGNKNWAVRCFTKEIRDLQQRYQSISSFISNNNCKFLVEAKYLQNGIKIKSIFFPIIKMSWLEGEPLNLYIENVYNQKAKLESLLNEFVLLINQLEGFGIAHGDLQHGNIIVKNGKLFLIDYDGMYLPNLVNLVVNELGHPNFQHPRRANQDYNNSIDNFSAIIIYTAIKAIILNPNLWRKYDNGDNLLFKGSDFANTAASELLKEIVNYPELKRLCNNIAAICTLDFNKIPTLKEFINGTIAPSKQILPQVTSVRSAYLVLDGTQKGKLLEHIGEKIEVIGRITDYRENTTKYGRPYVFMNMGSYPNQSFSVIIWSKGLTALEKRNIPSNSYNFEWVSITGIISMYKGIPQITIEEPSQIQVLKNESNAKAKLHYNTVKETSPIQTNSSKLIKGNTPNAINEEEFWENFFKDKSSISIGELPQSTPQPQAKVPQTPKKPPSSIWQTLRRLIGK